MNESQFTEGYASELLTVPEAARLLRISRNLAYELVARHELPAVHLGRAIRVPRSALDSWIMARLSQYRDVGAVSLRDG